MALLQISCFSDSLMMDISVQILFPQNCQRTPQDRKASMRGPYKVLYLLHGLKQDHTSWVRNSSLERYVSSLPLVVVMPSVHRSFYTNQTRGYPYFNYVADELPSLMKDMFNISSKREDTFVAGLSMGGYGAFKLALSRPHQYSHAGSLSGALDLVELGKHYEEEQNRPFPWEMTNTFGDVGTLEGSEHDLFALAGKLTTVKPKLFQSCGSEDFLLEGNHTFRDTFSASFDLTYHEESGAHTWDYWDRNIQKLLAWLPIVGSCPPQS